MLNHNLRRIICYIPYSEPVRPKRRNTVRTWTFERLPESETFCSVGFECEDCSAWLLPVRFTFPTLRYNSLCGLFSYFPEPIKEKSLLSRESQQRQPPQPMRFPQDFQALCHRSLPPPDLLCYEATFQIPETTFIPMRALLDPLFLQRSSSSRIWSSCSTPFNNYEDGY
jgi:hypothetical protein